MISGAAISGAHSPRAELGQFFTPQPVAAFVLDALMALGQGGGRLRVVDPACGKGVFLREARHRFPEAELWGCDLDAGLAGAWTEFSDTPRAHLFVQDGLVDAPLLGLGAGSFDLVIGNPPYGFDVPRQRPGERIEASFLKRFVELARRGGWVGAVVPEGIVANAQSQGLRDWLLGRVGLAAVVALPEATFARTGTHARTVVLLARKGGSGGGSALLARPTAERGGRDGLRAYLAEVLAALRNQVLGVRCSPAFHPPFGGARRQPVSS